MWVNLKPSSAKRRIGRFAMRHTSELPAPCNCFRNPQAMTFWRLKASARPAFFSVTFLRQSRMDVVRQMYCR
jgi:hypothetical protein